MRLKRKRKMNKALVLGVVALAVVAIAANYMMAGIFYDIELLFPIPEPSGQPVLPPSVEGYELVDVSTGPGTVQLSTGCKSIEMLTTEQQSSSIQDGIDGKVDFRPTAHDTMADILDIYWIDPLYVRIDSMEDGVYYSKLVLRSGDTVLTLDTRPTDAIAVAVRFGSPVYIKKGLLETYGEDTC